MKNNFKIFMLMLLSFLVGGIVMYLFVSKQDLRYLITDTKNPTGNTQVSNVSGGTIIVENGSLSAAVGKVFNSSVMIKTYKNDKVVGTGSGFVYKNDNDYTYILTNHHVVSNGSAFKIVNYNDDVLDAKLLGSDELLDLAVLRIKKTENMPSVTLGDVSKVMVGDQVFTVGTPVDETYRGTVTSGIVSGLNREITINLSSTNEEWVMQVIQTSAAVNPGNSGGPLVNAKGEVIGIVSLKLVEETIEGMGFAIPIDFAMSHIDSLEKGESIKRPFLGASLLSVETYRSYEQQQSFFGRKQDNPYAYLEIDDSLEEGVILVEITSGSGADKAGLKAGDVITQLNGVAISNNGYLKYVLYKYSPGDVVELTYVRGSKVEKAKVTLTEKKDN